MLCHLSYTRASTSYYRPWDGDVKFDITGWRFYTDIRNIVLPVQSV